jgi:chromosome partitioning protein
VSTSISAAFTGRVLALDLAAARPTLAALTRLDRPYCFILNACPPGRSARLDDDGRALSLLLASPPVVQRTDHVDAIGFGLGVTELDPEGNAAAEIRQLWAWIGRRLENKHAEASALA